MLTRLLAPAGAAVLSLACGNQARLSAPSATVPPAALASSRAVIDGLTGAPVAAIVDDIGARVRVSAPGYLTREQPRAATIFLWPAPDVEYVHRLVFTDGPTGKVTKPLQRWPPDAVLHHCLGPGVDAA